MQSNPISVIDHVYQNIFKIETDAYETDGGRCRIKYRPTGSSSSVLLNY